MTDDPTSDGTSNHRVRRVVVGVVLVLVAVIGTAAVLVSQREEPTARSTDEAVADLREQGGVATAPPAASGPATGVYAGTGEGNEYVGFSPLDEPFGPSIPVSVSYGDDGCWTYRVDLNSHHSRGWTLCTGPDDLAQSVGDSVTSRVFPGIDFENTSTFVCDPPAVLVRWDAAPGDSAQGSCVGTATGLEGETTYDAVATFVGPEVVTVDGDEVDVLHVRRDVVLVGAQTGTEVVDFWVLPDSGLPVQVAFDTQVATETPFGRIDYRDVGSVTLDALVAQR